MKKIVAAVVVFISVSGLVKASVDFTLSSPSAGLVTIGYNAQSSDNILSLPLKISLSDQATFPSSCIVSVHPYFNGFPDTPPGYDLGGPGGTGLGEPISQIDISLAALEGGPAPITVDNLITLRIQDGGIGFSYVTLSENVLRGGIIDTSGNHVGATFPGPLYVTIPEPATVSLLAFGGLALLRKRK